MMGEVAAMMWAWCSIFHRKHHTHSTNEFLCTNYRECGKCGSYVVSRNRKLERVKEQKDFERQRALVRTVYAPNLANMSDDIVGKLSGTFPPAPTKSYPPLASLPTLDSLEWPDEIE